MAFSFGGGNYWGWGKFFRLTELHKHSTSPFGLRWELLANAGDIRPKFILSQKEGRRRIKQKERSQEGHVQRVRGVRKELGEVGQFDQGSLKGGNAVLVATEEEADILRVEVGGDLASGCGEDELGGAGRNRLGRFLEERDIGLAVEDQNLDPGRTSGLEALGGGRVEGDSAIAPESIPHGLPQGRSGRTDEKDLHEPLHDGGWTTPRLRQIVFIQFHKKCQLKKTKA